MKTPLCLRCKIVLSLMFISFLIFRQASSAGGLPESEAITGINWAWQFTRNSSGNDITPPTPSRYTINFKNNGTFDIQADCNWGGGTYTIEENFITVKITHTTKAMCPPDSLEQTFIQHLNSSKRFYFIDDNLHVELKGDSGTMKLGE